MIALTILAAGCSRAPGGDGFVVASFFPLFDAAAQVAGTETEVTNLTPAGAEPHDIELSPDQVDALLDAHVLVFLGAGFQPAVEAVAADRAGITVDVLEEVEGLVGDLRGDPHVWLDPVAMQTVVRAIEGALVEADPGDDRAYRANAARAIEDLAALDGDFEAGLATCERDLIVTAHDAFGHLARRYGLRVEAISGVSPEAEPDPRRLAELEDLVRREGVTTIFTEELVSPEVAETLAREAGVRTAVLNPIEGLTAREEAAGDDYGSLMRRNLDVLREALGCR